MRKIETYFTPQSDGEGGSIKRERIPHSKSNISVASSAGDTSRGESNVQSTSHSATHPPEKPTSMTELRKANENLRIGKDQAEQKVLRLETELKSSYERQRQLEDRCSKLCNSLEDMHRLLAQQEGRRKRDLLAADCVRLGKISTMRSGSFPTVLW